MMAFFKTDVVKIMLPCLFFCFGQELFFPKIFEVTILQVLSSNLDPIEAEMWRGEMGETEFEWKMPIAKY